uniref:EB domain-containing protein n=1 Tax=Strigamia maritima TaxID=126957 RepID=T1ISR4_STRMM
MHLDQPCTKNEQCLYYDKGSVCKKETSLCQCSSNHKPLNHTNGTLFCTVIISETKAHPPAEEAKVDVTMMAVLISLAVMFIIMCIVLRMFSKAQFRDQRTIFNSPRLMKKSLSKARAERRASHVSLGSRAGSRAGSRHASIQSGLNLAGSRESIALPNSNSVKHLAAPIAEDDDANSGSRKLAKSEDSPHVAIQTSNENIASV